FPDNAFFLGDQLSGLIDFYFACNDALAYDVAIALNAWCFESDHAFNMTKGQALLKGYQSARALEPSEREALPLLARGAALRCLLRESRPRRLGRDIDLRPAPQGAVGRRGGDHQQSHGADGGDLGARISENRTLARRSAHRLRIRAERHPQLDPRLEKERMAH